MKNFEKMFTSKDTKIYQCAVINENTIKLINKVFGKLLTIEEKELDVTYTICRKNDDGSVTHLFDADYSDSLLVSDDGDVELTGLSPIAIGKTHKLDDLTINTAINRIDARRMYRVVNSRPYGRYHQVDGRVIKTIYNKLLETGMNFDIQIPGRGFTESDAIKISYYNTKAEDNIEVVLHYSDYLVIDYDVDRETHERSNYRIYSMSEDAVNQSKNIILI